MDYHLWTNQGWGISQFIVANFQLAARKSGYTSIGKGGLVCVTVFFAVYSESGWD